jgi:hypothetical protein
MHPYTKDEPPTAPDSAPTANCTCEHPVPRVRAEHKGAARTYCDRCGLPVRLSWQ